MLNLQIFLLFFPQKNGQVSCEGSQNTSSTAAGSEGGQISAGDDTVFEESDFA